MDPVRANAVLEHLRSAVFNGEEHANCLGQFLDNEEWLLEMCEGLTERGGDAFFTACMEWQLKQNRESQVRFSHMLVRLSERIKIPERTHYLITMAIITSVIVNIASPVKRLLTGQKRLECEKALRELRDGILATGSRSGPHVASRIRGFLGKIGRPI